MSIPEGTLIACGTMDNEARDYVTQAGGQVGYASTPVEQGNLESYQQAMRVALVRLPKHANIWHARGSYNIDFYLDKEETKKVYLILDLEADVRQTVLIFSGLEDYTEEEESKEDN